MKEATEAFVGDRITLDEAVKTDVWAFVWAVEPGRKINVGMTYDDLWKIVQDLRLPQANTVREKPTNADRIRSMTDEELADWLVMNGNGDDYKSWLKWLKEPVKDGDR